MKPAYIIIVVVVIILIIFWDKLFQSMGKNFASGATKEVKQDAGELLKKTGEDLLDIAWKKTKEKLKSLI